jgi:excisionase family DNA binding protein
MTPKLLSQNRRNLGKSQAADPAAIPEGRRWLKVRECSALLGVSVATLYRLHRRRELPSFKLPGLGVRVDREKIAAWIEEAQRSRCQ